MNALAVFLVLALASVSVECTPTSGVWVRVAEAGCEHAVELLTDDDRAVVLCPVVIDLVRLLEAAREAERTGSDLVVSYVDETGPRTLRVPARHVAAAGVSVRGAMEGR